MRESLLNDFNSLRVLDLRGSARKLSINEETDENVFDIQQGVSVGLFSKVPWVKSRRVHADLFGSRADKLTALGQGVLYTGISPTPPAFLFTPQSDHSDALWQDTLPLPKVMPVYASGVKTHMDDTMVALGDEVLANKIDRFIESFDDGSPVSATKRSSAQRKAALLREGRKRYPTLGQRRYAYRPFDTRDVAYMVEAIDAGDHRYPVMRHIMAGSLALVGTRQTSQGRFSHVFVAAEIGDMCLLSTATKECGYFSPLSLSDGPSAGSLFQPNLSPSFTARLAVLTALRFDDGSDAPAQGALPGTEPPPPPQGSLALQRERGDLETTFGARDVFDWIYAVLHSPAYRERYTDFLKSDFARVPLPNDRDLFAALIPLGTKLVALHLLDADVLPDLLKDPKVRFVSNGGEPRLGRFNTEVRRDAAGRVYLNDQNWFATVPQAAWEHWIGGYQPAQKWLKDRAQTGSKDKLKPGRLLMEEDILHYRRMIVALEETGKVMAEIDKVIADHGGWPDAFRGMAD